ncbi:unnamed protein product [Notodromas monacha]|uniref:Cell division control protein n=1 Tax=Notodromas monacha TaxID=399045 RepID=A0A7R9GHT7_9CRUS|nr:unnamed protein product [Notodromas monacha]CAG0921690.1 unnamed protein product [Notodromas monacha]
MLTRSRSAQKDPSVSKTCASPAVRDGAGRKCQSERRHREVRATLRRASDETRDEDQTKKAKSDEECSPLKSEIRSPLRETNYDKTPTKTPLSCKRSLQFNSQGKKFSARLQFPESPLKSPPRHVEPTVLKSVSMTRDTTFPVYQSIAKSLNISSTSDLVGREKEIRDIRDFLIEKMDSRSSGSMYVSGGPGTGKTACLTLILKEIGLRDSIFVNCLAKQTPLALLKDIASSLGIKTGLADVGELLRGIERRTSGRRDTVVVVLDEIDALASKFQENLYALFSMPAKKDSRLVLVGVANALDLTTRVLPHLKWLAPETRPVLIHFRPYSKFQLGQIISKRLGPDGVKVLPPLVVQYIAGKVANLNGDCRRALDVCRACVDRKLAESRQQKFVQNGENKENQDVVAVSLPEVAKVFGDGIVTGLTANRAGKSDGGSLPLLQKLALLALWLVMTRVKKEPLVSLAKLYDVFRKVCARTGSMSSVVSKSEFTSLCSLLESRGMIELRDGLGAPKTPALFKSPRCTSILLRASLLDLERDLRADESCRIFVPLLDNPAIGS